MPVLTAIDVLGIQSYIFTSNRLRDVIGASHVVDWATNKKYLCNLLNIPIDKVLIAAGGNAIIEFDTLSHAQSAIKLYTRNLLAEAPGLEVAIVHHQYQSGNLAKGLVSLPILLAQEKLQRQPHVPQLGLSVTEKCRITGLPASRLDREQGPISEQIKAVRNKVKLANKRWNTFLPGDDSRKFIFPDQIDKLGRTSGDTSLIGVVHIDGNGIGELIRSWLGSCIDSEKSDDKIRSEFQEWSTALCQLGENVLRAIVRRVINCIDYNNILAGHPQELSFELASTTALPLRPILLGGDDLTFICDGRIALDLASAALRQFGKHSLPYLGAVTACAGVALVKSHAPFSRGYELSEQLCQSAKAKKREKEQLSNRNSGCWIDWHLGAIRPHESVAEVRKRQYQNGQLTCRPYPLSGDGLTWEWLDSKLLGKPHSASVNQHSLRNTSIWGERRNKIKALPALAREDPAAIKQQMAAWRILESKVGFPPPLDDTGFISNRTPLIDAIELLDIHLQLPKDEVLSP